ncbi:MAG: hypothetical protein KC618_06520 [Candidatus Omnitrophica bacterium]|nr:hypothetical protein [Candidatus Omnitrophota bacterium]
MFKKLILILSMLVLIPTGMTFAGGEDHQMPPPYEGSVEFQKIKSLAGEWRGKHTMGDQEIEVSATYAVTSNGSAVVETLNPGTADEMVSIYSDVKGKLSMTHYCALANAPKLDLKASDDHSITLDFAADNAIDPTAEQHMHGLMITFLEGDKIEHNWSYYSDGQQAGSTVITLSRVK